MSLNLLRLSENNQSVIGGKIYLQINQLVILVNFKENQFRHLLATYSGTGLYPAYLVILLENFAYIYLYICLFSRKITNSARYSGFPLNVARPSFDVGII